MRKTCKPSSTAQEPWRRFRHRPFHELESRRKAVQTETESQQARRNALAKQIGQLKGKGAPEAKCRP
ncbi:hypothetical protein [Bordetella holmesii]|uniref:hypothetical protein n=1 Tax=Bordetella holmesii TaxID=35814 RepID=UPI00351AE020